MKQPIFTGVATALVTPFRTPDHNAVISNIDDARRFVARGSSTRILL